MSGISAYEKARLQTIAENRAVLAELGLEDFTLSPAARKHPLSEAELAARIEAKRKRLANAKKNRRWSSRLKGQSTTGRKSSRELRALRDEQDRLDGWGLALIGVQR